MKIKNFIKPLFCCVTAAILFISAIGCGKGSTSSAGGDKGKSDIKVSDDLKGTTVKILLWYEPPVRETSVSDKFTEKTGINIKYVTTTEANYQTKLASLVASGSSPDLASCTYRTYPSMIIRGLLQPLSDENYDFSDKGYDIDLMKGYKWNDKYYSVAVKGSMMGNMYVVYYNKTMFEERGQKTPYDIWKKNPNDWTWDKFSQLAKTMTYDTSAGKVYGVSCAYPQAFMLSTGEDFVKVSGATITNNMTAAGLKTAWKYLNNIKEVDKSLYPGNAFSTDFVQGKVAMHINGQWLMQADNDYASMTDKWGVAPFPKQNSGDYYTPFSGVMWGVPVNAKNLKGGASFIRYWLDPANEQSAIYANDECKDVHKWIWEQPKSILYSQGIIGFKSDSDFTTLCNNLMGGASAVDTVLTSNSPTVDSSIQLVLDEMN